jgi:hypothetical protein
MNRSGRDYVVQTTRNDKEKGVRVLESAYYNVDCLFLHFRESPCLWKSQQVASKSVRRPSRVNLGSLLRSSSRYSRMNELTDFF